MYVSAVGSIGSARGSRGALGVLYVDWDWDDDGPAAVFVAPRCKTAVEDDALGDRDVPGVLPT